jgi:predicted ATP-dependent endonuclease of OLD family
MEDIFIKSIKINSVRHLKDLTIPLSDTERKHLMITGKNGSGKTSVLEEIKNVLNRHYGAPYNDSMQKVDVSFRNDFTPELFIPLHLRKGDFIFSYFPAKRGNKMTAPNGIQKVELSKAYNVDTAANVNFIQYIVNLKAQRSFARDANKMDTVAEIDQWFATFEAFLREIFEDQALELVFDPQNFDFQIVQPGKEPFNLNTLSDGYSAIINVISELMMRMEKQSSRAYNVQGVVLIDEIETHLHIDLQKVIMPFLTKIFPKIQFIVTTHSPFVLHSISNAVVYDLEHKMAISDMSGYSVESIIEGYFNADKYSEILKITP